MLKLGTHATLGAALEAAVVALAGTGPTPRLDAEVLAMHVCGLSRARLAVARARELDREQQARFEALLARRIAGEPVAYITGEREFWSLALAVTPATLIPRPETERLVETALARIPHDADWRVADLGTGCGAIAIALAHERPHCEITAVDACAQALAVARENVRRHRLRNIALRLGEWFAPIEGRSFDLVVSNPPYIPSADPHLAAGDLRFEPRAALDGGADGLDAIRHIAGTARRHLRRDGFLVLEHGWNQGEAVRELLQSHGYREILTHRDLAGHERVTECRSPQAIGDVR